MPTCADVAQPALGGVVRLASFPGSPSPAAPGRPSSYPLCRFAFDFRQPAQYSLCMKVNEILVRLQNDGWYLVATRGSHRQFKHQEKPGRVTVAGKPSDELAPGTLNSILKQARLK